MAELRRIYKKMLLMARAVQPADKRLKAIEDIRKGFKEHKNEANEEK